MFSKLSAFIDAHPKTVNTFFICFVAFAAIYVLFIDDDNANLDRHPGGPNHELEWVKGLFR